MAKEVSRTFDTEKGAIHVTVVNNLGHQSVHTIYVLETSDPQAEIAAAIGRVANDTERIKARFAAAGWIDGSTTRKS